jgi:metallo-beta-lactamase class B
MTVTRLNGARLPPAWCHLLFVLLLAVAGGAVAQELFRADPPIVCADCDDWNAPQEPFRVFGNTYYVGTAGLSAALIASDAGHILIDGGLPQSAPLIEANIRALGFQLRDVRLIVNSHEHYDHAGGIPALQRASGAKVAASAAGARALTQGHPVPDDPQYQSGLNERFPPVTTVETISDGAALKVGSLAVTAHFTPGHTPGATSWSWRSCEDARCVDIVYVDSLNPVSDDGFRFTGDSTRPSIEDVFRRSIARVEQLPCDVVLPPHPGFVNLRQKAARLKKQPTQNPFVQANACRSYAAIVRKRLDQRVGEERK